MPFLVDGIPHCDIIKLREELGVVQPDFALLSAGQKLHRAGRLQGTPALTTAREESGEREERVHTVYKIYTLTLHV